jgi:transposase
MKTASIDLRKRVITAYLEGDTTYAKVAERFCIGEASVSRWLRLYRETGSVSPQPHGGGNRAKIDAEGLELLRQMVAKRPDATLKELAETYEDKRSVTVALNIVYRALQRLGLTRKKRQFTR